MPNGRAHESGSRAQTRGVGRLVVGLLIVTIVAFPVPAMASHWTGWSHDHSSNGIPPRPQGYKGLKATFGQPCSGSADDASTYFPSAYGRNSGGYVQYHPYLAVNVANNIRGHIGSAHRDGAVDYLVSGYYCRYIDGTTKYSTHSFGAAIDTNTARNPQGQSTWNGIGADGKNHGKYIPNTWRGADPGHRFKWGITFSNPDPMHFQYVTGY